MTSLDSGHATSLLAHAAGVRRLALALTRDVELAEDAVQHALVEALERRPDEARPLAPWLARVARRWIANARRSSRNRIAIESRAARVEALASTQDLVIRAELHRELVAVVLTLDERQRDVILLRYLEGLAPRDIATRLDVPLRTVNTRLSRGLARLRSELDRRGGRERWLRGLLLLTHSSSRSVAVGIPLMKLKLSIAAVVIALAIVGLRTFDVDWTGKRPTAAATEPSALELAQRDERELSTTARSEVALGAAAATVANVDVERDLRVIVVTTAGQPIADAALAVLRPTGRQLGMFEGRTHSDEPIARSRSDAEGRATFRLEPRLVYDVIASAPGFARVASRNLYAGEELRIVLPRAAALRGTVTSEPDGLPVADARVQARLGVIGSLADDGFETRTDANGGFELTELPADSVQVVVEAEGFPRLDELVGVVREGEHREVHLVLARGPTVRGQVTDGSTKLPLENATVEILGAHETNHATTDAGGRYVLRGAAAGTSVTIAARAPGYGDFQITAAAVERGDIVQDIFLLPGRRAVGRIVDSRGAPIAGASIVARASAYAQWTNQAETRRTQSDGAGRFELAGLRVDLRHTLLVHSVALATAVRDFPAGEWDSMELDLGDVVLAPPAAIAGHVRDPAGNPVAGVWVLLDGEPRDRDAWKPASQDAVGYMDEEGLGFGRILARTHARGRYCFGELPAGSYRLWAGDKGFARGAELQVQLEEGEQLLDVEIELDTEPSIRGIVFDVDQHPVAGVTVEAFLVDPSAAMRTRATYALTALDGTFALCGLDAATYDLQLDDGLRWSNKSARLARRAVHDIRAGARDLRISMARALETTVRVVGPDGAPQPGAWVMTRTEATEYGWEVLGATDADGRFVLWVEESTTARLRVAPPRGSTLTGYVPVFGADGKVDTSFEVEVSDVRAGSSDAVVRFERLP